jgi:hypothetical protein
MGFRMLPKGEYMAAVQPSASRLSASAERARNTVSKDSTESNFDFQGASV